MGGPGDLMETKVKGNNFRESRGGPEILGRQEGCFGERLGSHPGFTLGFFYFSLSSSPPLPPSPGVAPSRHSGCYGVIPELSVPGHRLFFSYSLNVIRHVSRHRRDCSACQCQDKLSEFDKALMVSVFSRSYGWRPCVIDILENVVTTQRPKMDIQDEFVLESFLHVIIYPLIK